MAAYPLIITQLDRVRVVVVGGGAVAERKVVGLIAGGARPVVISPDLTVELTSWHAAGALEWLVRCYAAGDLAGAFLAVAATNDQVVNAQVATEAQARGVLANIGDEPGAGSFTTTATVRRGDLLIAVTTNGASPALTARIRRELEAEYGAEYATLLALLRDLRAGPARDLPPARRIALLRQLASDQVLAWVRAGQIERIHALIEQMIRDA